MSNELAGKLGAMLDAYRSHGLILPAPIDEYVRSICRRLDFITMQREILMAIDWSSFWNAGMFDHRANAISYTEIEVQNANGESRLLMRIADQDLCKSIVYKAFDDIVSGSVNIQDTFGRLLNEVHGSRINERRASLGGLRSAIEDSCLLARFLDQSNEYSQLYLLRDIRGRLQHSAFEHR